MFKKMLFVIVSSLFLLTHYELLAQSSNSKTQVQQINTLTVVEAKYVCMINNKLFEEVQIPVVVEDRTYYGCCEMCERLLKVDPESRKTTDPVSGKTIDKATAVIGALPDGKVYYFENKINLKKFKPELESDENASSRM